MMNIQLVLTRMNKFMMVMLLVNTLKVLMTNMSMTKNPIAFSARTPDYRSSFREPWQRRPRLPGRPGPR